MTTTVKIDMSNPMALPLVNYLESLPFTSLKKDSRKSFKEAAKECNAVPVSAFSDELHRQIDQYFDEIENA